MNPIRREIVSTKEAAGPGVAPLNQAIIADRFVFTSGCLGIDKNTGKLVPGGIIPETQKVLENLSAVLKAAGSSIEKVVKATVYLNDINDFTKVNEEYKKVFATDFPARTCFQVGKLPLGGLVEIEAVGIIGNVDFVKSTL